jgi:3-hydroxyisobutyrate dehydrogenase
VKIGFIGLGMMGRPMAERLIASGFSVRVSDSNAALAEAFGAAWAANAAEACADADIVVTMLPNGHIVRDVLDGAALKSGTVVIDTSSSDAGGTVELGERLAARDIRLIDAPVSGGVALAREGRLALMVGCPDDALFATVEPVLQALGARILRVGQLGAGHAAKAINNAIAACIFAVTSEGLVLGERFGLDPALLLEVINSSTGRSGVSEGLFPAHVLSGRYALGFALALMTKDVGLADGLRDRLDLDLPLIAKTHAELAAALGELEAGADFTAFHRFTQARAGADR